ncbi:HAD hydrolase family protein [Shigella flexneri]
MAIKLIAIDINSIFCCQSHHFTAVKNTIAAARARGVNVVLTTGRPYAGVHNYLKELHMEQPGDYCITYNSRRVGTRRPPMVAPSRKPLSAMTTTVSWKNSLAKSVLISTPWTAPRCIQQIAISATTPVHESFVATFAGVLRSEKMDPNTQFLKVMMIDEPAILDQAIARIPQEVKEKYTVLKSAPYSSKSSINALTRVRV